MDCLVIGYGSIGSRHARILDSLGHTVSIVSRRKLDVPFTCHGSLEDAFKTGRYDYLVVADRTSEHKATLEKVAASGFSGKVLVEKPLFQNVSPLPTHAFLSAHVGYNLRFHPIIQRIRELISGQAIFAIHAHCGSYLPDWRPGTDYTQCYSAIREQGGGVLRDLSHEIDYLLWLSDGWTRLTALGGTFGDLSIDADDTYCITFQGPLCPTATLTLNYLERTPRREVTVLCSNMTIRADLISGTLSAGEISEEYTVQRDDTYISQHQGILDDPNTIACTFDEGLEVVQFIDAAERSSKEKTWVTR